MHPLVPAQVGELCVCLQTHLALEGLDRTVNVLVLFQSARRGERFAALDARVASRPDVLRADVTLEVARVCEHLVTVLARKRLITVILETVILKHNK